MKKIIVDRFEGDFAVVELPNGRMIDCPKALLPDNVEEGSILKIIVDETATNEKLKRVTERMNKLFKD